MKKLLAVVLTLCMVLSLSVSSFATTSNWDNDAELDEAISELSDKFDIKHVKDFYEESGMAIYKDLQIVNDNVITYAMDWQRIGVTTDITEEILDDGRLKKTYTEGDLINEVIYDKENGTIIVDGNMVDVSEETQITENLSDVTPMAIPVWVYSSTPWGGTNASDYSTNVWAGYKNVQYGSLIRSLTIAFIADRIAMALGGYSLAVAISAAGVDWMASQAKSKSSPYSKTGKCYEVQKCIPSDVETRYRHTVKYYDDYDGSYLFTKDFYSMFV